MTTFPDKTAAPGAGLKKQTGRAWLDILLVILLVATVLSLLGGADGIHCASGMLMLAACSIHLIRHGRWIKVVILGKPPSSAPILLRQRRLFWAMLLSGLLCGLSGLAALFSVHLFLPLLCLVTPLHMVSGLAFLSLITYHLVQHRNWFTTRIG